MVNPFPLRRSQAGPLAAAPAGVKSRKLPDGGTLPFGPGEELMTDLEATELVKLGIDPNVPLPPDVTAKIRASRAAVSADIQEAIDKVAGSGRVLRGPDKIVSIDDLPANRQEELRKDLLEGQEMAGKVDVAELQRRAFATMDPGIRNVLQRSKQVEGFDGNGAKAPSADNDKPETLFSEGDKIAYLASVFSDPPGPFTRHYSFFNGRLAVVYQDLSVAASEFAARQTSWEKQQGELPTPADVQRRLAHYRLCLSLQSITFNNQSFQVSDELLNALPEKWDYSALPGLLMRLTSQGPLARESVWRTLGVGWKKFRQLLSQLEVCAEEPSFWPPIET